MKKNRHSFFSESNYQSYNPGPNITPEMAPYQAASNYFYQGPIPGNPQNNYNTIGLNNDIESRIAKIERQINRIDYRLNKLENISNIKTSDDYDLGNQNMYML